MKRRRYICVNESVKYQEITSKSVGPYEGRMAAVSCRRSDGDDGVLKVPLTGRLTCMKVFLGVACACAQNLTAPRRAGQWRRLWAHPLCPQL